MGDLQIEGRRDSHGCHQARTRAIESARRLPRQYKLDTKKILLGFMKSHKVILLE
jgi:hypothetical protein